MSLNRPSAVEYFNRSGVIATPDASGTPQMVLDYHSGRIGFDFQNQGAHDMYLAIHDLTADNGVIRFKVPPGETWYKDQFAPINVVSVEGTPGEPFAASEYGL